MSAEPQAEPATHRIEDLWFEDANLVILAGAAGLAQYKVLRSILAKHSPAFRDMLALPQPAGEESVDGCAVVRLRDEEAEVTPFLKALFDPSFPKEFVNDNGPGLVSLYGCLRLAHKYDVEFLRRRALEHFSNSFATTLQDYVERIHFSRKPWDRRSLMLMLQLAREVDATWVLPHLFLRLAADFFHLGTVTFRETQFVGVTVELSAEDQETLLKGFEEQLVHRHDVHRFLTAADDVQGCATPLACMRQRLLALETVRQCTGKNTADPIIAWMDDDWELLEGLCAGCLTSAQVAHQDFLVAFWERLPEMYALPPWKELEIMKRSALGDMPEEDSEEEGEEEEGEEEEGEEEEEGGEEEEGVEGAEEETDT